MKTTETIIEIHQVQVIRRRERETEGWCAACAAVARMITPESAAVLVGTSRRAIYRRIEAGEFHLTETPDGAVFICLNAFPYHPTEENL